MSTASLNLHRVSKRYGAAAAVDDVTLEIRQGEFFSILGPSGCGKTTLLRLIAGFETPDQGRIVIAGNDVTAVPPAARGVGLVFQNYALFPHLTVDRNVAFGLETRGLQRQEVVDRVEATLRAVRMQGRGSDAVYSLSGGEQQRVALARAIAVQPSVLLLDEPLSNLDAALRESTREELRGLQRSTHVTMVYVTHDQAEAMSLSDRIAVMRSGRVEQVGTPAVLYDSPATPFVAGFLGGAGLLSATVDAGGESLTFGGGTVPLPGSGPPWPPGPARVAVKPEAVRISERGGGCPARVTDIEYHGFLTTLRLRMGNEQIRAVVLTSPRTRPPAPGEEVGVTFERERCTRFPPESS